MASTSSPVQIIGSFSNDDSDSNEKVKKAIGLISKTTTLHVQHTFFVHFPALTARLRHEIRFPKRLFMEDLNTRWQDSLSPFKLGCGPQEFNSKKIHLHSIFHESRNNGDKISKKSEVFVVKFLLLSLLLKLPERLHAYWAVYRSYRAVLGCDRDWLSIVLNCTMGYMKYIKGYGNLSFGSVKGPKKASRWILWP